MWMHIHELQLVFDNQNSLLLKKNKKKIEIIKKDLST